MFIKKEVKNHMTDEKIALSVTEASAALGVSRPT